MFDLWNYTRWLITPSFPDTPNLSDELIQIANKHSQDEEAATAQSMQIKNMLDQYNAIVSFNMKKALLDVCL